MRWPWVDPLELRLLLSAVPTTTALVAAPVAVVAGRPVTLTATVADAPGAATPTGGTVTFLDGTAAIGTAPLVAGTARLSIPTLGVGAHALSAVYLGDGANFLGSSSTATTAGIIPRYAGLGLYSGDGGPATAATLNQPYGVATDAAGDLFIADTFNNVVREVKPGGAITTVAGTSGFGPTGDGGPATAATLITPYGVAVDAAGDIFIADFGNNAVREVKPGGVITTVAGSGTPGRSGDGGPATTAMLRNPHGVAVDGSGDLFIADSGNDVVREVKPGGIITTVAGNGSYGLTGDGGPAIAATLQYPTGLALDAAGDLFIADSINNVVREVKPGGIITTVAGIGLNNETGDGGPATAATLSQPNGVAVDGAGDLFIADTTTGVVREVKPGGVISTAAGSHHAGDGGPATAASLDQPGGVAADAAGDLFIADTRDDAIREVRPGGIITTVAGTGTAGHSGDGGPATAATLDQPGGVAADAAGDLFIADTFNNVVREVKPGGIITTVAGNGRFGSTGDGGPATAAELSGPSSLALDAAGDLFIADSFNDLVREVTPGGIITTVAGTGTAGYSGDGGPATAATLNDPVGIAVDGAGDLFIADDGNHVVREVKPGGFITTFAGNGASSGGEGEVDGGPATAATLGNPAGLAVDAAGDLFILDAGTGAIREVRPDGIIGVRP